MRNAITVSCCWLQWLAPQRSAAISGSLRLPLYRTSLQSERSLPPAGLPHAFSGPQRQPSLPHAHTRSVATCSAVQPPSTTCGAFPTSTLALRAAPASWSVRLG